MTLLIVERIQVNVMSYSVSIVSNHRGEQVEDMKPADLEWWECQRGRG